MCRKILIYLILVKIFLCISRCKMEKTLKCVKSLLLGACFLDPLWVWGGWVWIIWSVEATPFFTLVWWNVRGLLNLKVFCLSLWLTQRYICPLLFLTPRLPGFLIGRRLNSHALELLQLDRALCRLGPHQLSDPEIRQVSQPACSRFHILMFRQIFMMSCALLG